MNITEEDVLKVAELAHLSIDAKDLPDLVGDLKNILGLVNQMSELDTHSVQPLAHPHESIQRLRTDQVTETDQHHLFQQSGPEVCEGLYQVPKVIT